MDFFGDDETETPGQNTDSVEADVLIDTTIENAWALVSEPGWWINDGPLGDHDVEHGDDGLYHVTDPWMSCDSAGIPWPVMNSPKKC